MIALLAACVSFDIAHADLQLDLQGTVPEAAERIRICVEGVGVSEQGLRFDGLHAVPGLPAGEPLSVTVDLLDAGGTVAARGTAASLAGYAVSSLVDCSGGCAPCEASGSFAPEGDPAWLLAVRLLG